MFVLFIYLAFNWIEKRIFDVTTLMTYFSIILRALARFNLPQIYSEDEFYNNDIVNTALFRMPN